MTFRKKINILLISSSSALGGGTKHMFMLGENLKNEFGIFYAIPKNEYFLEFLNPKNSIDIHERKIKLTDIFNLIKFVKVNSIDIIHAHGKGAGGISRILKLFINRPLIYTFHGIHLECHNWSYRLAYIIYEYLLGWIDSKKILVSQSENNYAKKSKIFLGNKSLIINNGVRNMTIKNYSEKDFDNKSFLASNKTNVISVCRFVQQKNIYEIIRIAIELPNINFYIIGDGPLWHQLKNFIDIKILKNVILLGSKRNVFRYLYEADIYLSTSLYEGLPLSIIEAMSIGLPIVASNVAGNCDTIIHGKSGFYYDLSDINKAVGYLTKLSKNKLLKQKLGKAAFQRQREFFSRQKMLSKYKKLYNEIFIF